MRSAFDGLSKCRKLLSGRREPSPSSTGMIEPMKDFPAWPRYSEDEAHAVRDVLLSNRVNYLTAGESGVGRDFERRFARFADSRHAIAVANGTLALDLALHGLGIGRANGGSETDEVVVTPRSFIASVSTVVNALAVPVFADVDRDSGNLSAATIAPVLTERTRAIIVVHLAGWPADMAPIMALARARHPRHRGLRPGAWRALPRAQRRFDRRCRGMVVLH